MKLNRLISPLTIFCILLATTAFAGNYHMTDTEYGQIEYAMFQGDNDGAIIFIHGNADQTKQQARIIAEDSTGYGIAKKMNIDTGKTVIAIARPGFGNSFGEKPGGNVTVETCKNKHVAACVEGLTNIISTNGLTNVTILGFSGGARIGATYTLRHPDNIKRAVLYDGTYDVNLWQKLKGKSKKVQTDTMKDLEVVDAPNSVEYILMYGEKSKMVDPKVSKRFNKEMSGKNFNVTLLGVPGAKHLDFLFNPKVYDAYLAQVKK